MGCWGWLTAWRPSRRLGGSVFSSLGGPSLGRMCDRQSPALAVRRDIGRGAFVLLSLLLALPFRSSI